jgi:5-methylcytosine-specific restriction endonuclease McrA
MERKVAGKTAAAHSLPPSRKRWYVGQCVECGQWFVHDQPQTRTCSLTCSRRWHGRFGRHARRARKRGAFVARVYRQKIFERDRWRCKLCGKPVARTMVVPHPKAPVLDHIVPLAQGGKHEPANVQCAHFICNSLKGDRPANEQLMLVG